MPRGISTVVTAATGAPAELVDRYLSCQMSVLGYIQASARRLARMSPGA